MPAFQTNAAAKRADEKKHAIIFYNIVAVSALCSKPKLVLSAFLFNANEG
jgi:hypothetical protein